MMFRISNPSDPYTMTSDDPKMAAVATLLLGQGAYGLTDETDAKVLPIFLFGGVEGWLAEQKIESLDAFIDEHHKALADALDSVLCGDFDDRKEYERILAPITDSGERASARAKWNDARRSSLNDIGERASSMAGRLRALSIEAKSA